MKLKDIEPGIWFWLRTHSKRYTLSKLGDGDQSILPLVRCKLEVRARPKGTKATLPVGTVMAFAGESEITPIKSRKVAADKIK